MTPHIHFPVEGQFKQNDQTSGLNLETHIFKKAEILFQYNTTHWDFYTAPFFFSKIKK